MAERRQTRGFTLIELMIVVAILGILAAIAVPNFLKFQVRARQSEAKTNLKGIFTSTKAHFAENGTYLCGSCGFEAKKNRYGYFFGSPIPHSDIPADPSVAKPGANCTYSGPAPPRQSAGSFRVGAAGDIDADATCDSWSIDDANKLSNDVDDVGT